MTLLLKINRYKRLGYVLDHIGVDCLGDWFGVSGDADSVKTLDEFMKKNPPFFLIYKPIRIIVISLITNNKKNGRKTVFTNSQLKVHRNNITPMSTNIIPIYHITNFQVSENKIMIILIQIKMTLFCIVKSL